MRFLLLPALAVLACAAPARAACDASNQFTFDWNSQADTYLSYAGTYTYTVTNALGATRTMQTKFTTNGLASNQVAGVPMPVIAAVHTGTLATTEKTLTIGGRLGARTTSITGATNIMTVTFTFSTPVRDVSFRVFDVDFTSNAWRDWVKLTGSDGTTTYDAALTKPAASTVKLGPNATAPAIGSAEALGTSTSDLTQDIGTIVTSFPQPVTSVTLRYGNYPRQTGETVTDEQWLSIHDVSFCPLPALAVSKSSTPYATTGAARFNAPGSDVAYALTVTNSGGSPVDIGTLVLTDPLPANVTFYNGDYDATSPGMGPVQLTAGTSGVTLPASGISFSTDGTTYSTTATAGYNAGVRYLKLTPTGSLAANSSVTLRFRARIN